MCKPGQISQGNGSGATLTPAWRGSTALMLLRCVLPPWRSDNTTSQEEEPGWGAARRKRSLWKNRTNREMEPFSRDTFSWQNNVLHRQFRVGRYGWQLLFSTPARLVFLPGCILTIWLSVTASPGRTWLGLTFPDHDESGDSSLAFGCLKPLETGGTLEITHIRPISDFMGQEGGGADSVDGVLEPPLERSGHDLRERSFKAALLALSRSHIFSLIYLSFIIHPSFMHPYPRGHGDNWSQPLQGPSFLKDVWTENIPLSV